jgi:glycine/D-amino acid oxidase-like deaminating enzyme
MYSQEISPGGWDKTSNLISTPYWLDTENRPPARTAFEGYSKVDLVIVGGGFTGLWAAVEAALQNPDQRVVVLEGGRIADGASGRNGGFVSASLTHGFRNGVSRWPHEIDQLELLGRENLAAIGDRIEEFGIDCDWIMSGEIDVAIAPYQAADLVDLHEQMHTHGIPSQLLDLHEVRARVNSPLYMAGLFDPHVAMVNPAELAWGLARRAELLGVEIYENSPVTSLDDQGSHVVVGAAAGVITTPKVLLATNAYPPILRRLRHYVVPVYDYVLMTEPLTLEQRSSINWEGREGIGDSGNQFHYYRLTKDFRILFGGFDAIYHKNNGMSPAFDVDRDCLARLADHFVETFPQLSAVRFTHGWGGAIDTCSRFSAFWGVAHGGKTAYVAGYTGLGVGASRFGALTCLDLLEGRTTERTQLTMVKEKPIPFPPEPLRSLGIDWTTRSLQRADSHEGKRNLWLRTLDKLGLGFDS